MESIINEEPDLEVVGSVFSGEKALDFLKTQTADVITLDVQMPGLGGIDTLKEIQLQNTQLPRDQQMGILMVSAYTLEQSGVTDEALKSGAYDFVTKPSTQLTEQTPAAFGRALVAKLRQHRRQFRRADPILTKPSLLRERSDPGSLISTDFKVILIGASTGGPRALAELLPALTLATEAPILIVQHLPLGFTQSLAENLQRQSEWPVLEAEPDQPILSRHIYLAPGGRHLTLKYQPPGTLTAHLTDDPPESGCRPSASVLFRSAAPTLGREALAIILTGMGNDGAAGLQTLHRAGGFVIAQDEPTSVVWGMPGSAVAASAVDRVLPIDLIADQVARLRRSRTTI